MQAAKFSSVAWLALAVLAAAQAGCAGAAKARPQPVEQALPPPATGPVVARLADGREGFIITETPGGDAEARRDFEQAVAMMQNQDFDKAVGLLEKVIERLPGVTAPHINIALAYGQTGKQEQAEQHLKTALSLVPDHPVASNEYGLLLRRAGRFAEARAIFEKTLAAFPEYLPARRNLGILCDLYLNDPACALEQYERYSQAMPKDEQVGVWVVDLHARLGR